MAKDTRQVLTGIWTPGGTLTDADEIEEKLSAKEIASLIERGALSGEWHGTESAKPAQSPAANADELKAKDDEIARLKAELEAAQKATPPTTVPTLANAPHNPAQGRNK